MKISLDAFHSRISYLENRVEELEDFAIEATALLLSMQPQPLNFLTPYKSDLKRGQDAIFKRLGNILKEMEKRR